ncbi:MAG: cupredoxin domain-containing protein [Chloroflexi bacterium]|nr:cupredoxin domain-containing protein [Chloroflexota bacterium]
MTLKNNGFPKEMRVKAGAKLVFVITNQGTVKHTFEFPDFKINNEIQPQETVRFEWVVPDRKGKWDMGCFLTEEGYHERMEGTLIIE